MVTFRTRSLYSLCNTANVYAMVINKLVQLWNKSLPQRDTQLGMAEHTAKQKVDQPERSSQGFSKRKGESLPLQEEAERNQSV